MEGEQKALTFDEILTKYYNMRKIGCIKATARASLEIVLLSLSDRPTWGRFRDDNVLLITFRDGKYKGRSVKYYSDDELKELISEFHKK